MTAVEALHPVPDEVIVGGPIRLGQCSWRHPQAFYLQKAIEHADTDWVVISDIDDLLYPDALAGLEDVAADVWQMGFDDYVVPQLTAEEYLRLEGNPFVGSSAIRVSSFHAVGGFHDIAFQDWGLWRRMARAGMTFESSGRAHFRYRPAPGRARQHRAHPAATGHPPGRDDGKRTCGRLTCPPSSSLAAAKT